MGTWKHLLQVTTLAVLASACGTSSSTSVNAPSARCAVTATAQPSGGRGSRRVRFDHREHGPRMRVGSAQRGGLAGDLRLVRPRRRLDALHGGGQPGRQRAARRGRRQRIAGRDRTGGGGVRLQPRRVAAVGRPPPADASTSRCRPRRAAPGRRAATLRGSPSCPARPARASGAVSLSVSANPAAQARSSVVTIAGQPFVIEQAGAVVAGPSPHRPGTPTNPAALLTVSPMTASVGAEGGAIEVRVSASAATCSWTAVSGVPWIVMEGGVSQTGSGSRRFAVAPNTTSESRVGSLGIAGAVVTVTQAAGSSPAPTPATPHRRRHHPRRHHHRRRRHRRRRRRRHRRRRRRAPTPISPNPVDVRFSGDDDIDLHVVTSAGCAWTATSQASWITITGASSGSGDGHVRIAVAATLAVNGRVGTLSIAGRRSRSTRRASSTSR